MVAKWVQVLKQLDELVEVHVWHSILVAGGISLLGAWGRLERLDVWMRLEGRLPAAATAAQAIPCLEVVAACCPARLQKMCVHGLAQQEQPEVAAAAKQLLPGVDVVVV